MHTTAQSGTALDVDNLLAPIPGNRPHGVDPGRKVDRNGMTAHSVIKEMMREEDSSDPNNPNPKRAEWPKVLTRCQETLKKQGKDMQICIWWFWAAVAVHGWAALAPGLRLIRGLHDRYWDHFYPEIERTDSAVDLGMRVGRLENLEGRLQLLILEMPVTARYKGHGYTFLDYSRIDNRTLPGTVEAEEQSNLAERFEKACTATGSDMLQEVLGHLEEFESEIGHLVEMLREKYADEADGPPRFDKVRESVLAVRKMVNRLLEAKGIFVEPTDGADATESHSATTVETQLVAAGGGPPSIRSRKELVAVLRLAVDYLGHTEPHNPARFNIERAIRWLCMSLPEILQELIRDEGELKHVFLLLGHAVPRPKEDAA